MHIPVSFQSQTLTRYVSTEEEFGTSYKMCILYIPYVSYDLTHWFGENAIVQPIVSITTKAFQDSKKPVVMLEKPPSNTSIY